MELVTIFTGADKAEATLVKARLEANGFHAELMGETALTDLYGFGGKTRVQVPDEEAEDARALLSSEDEK